MSQIHQTLTKYGLSDKEIKVYLALLKLGPSPVRKIGVEAKVNRGTTYDILKSLRDQGLVSYYHKETRQYFVAEDPKRFFDAVNTKIDHYDNLKRDFHQVIPKLREINTVMQERPTITYYDGLQGIRTILYDVLDTVESSKEKVYYNYSSSTLKKYLYAAYPEYTDDRIERGIAVRVISIGPGGQVIGLDERKWLTEKESSPTYTLIYPDSVAMISTDKHGMPIGLIINDPNLYQTQKLLFEKMWDQL